MNQVSAYKFFIEKIRGASGTTHPPPPKKKKKKKKNSTASIYVSSKKISFTQISEEKIFIAVVSVTF